MLPESGRLTQKEDYEKTHVTKHFINQLKPHF